MGKWNYPETRKTDYCEAYHGETVADPYAWLERGRDEEVLDWVRREHECTDRFFAGFGNELEEKMDESCEKSRQDQISRLKDHQIDGSFCVVISEVLTDLERIQDHYHNLAQQLFYDEQSLQQAK